MIDFNLGISLHLKEGCAISIVGFEITNRGKCLIDNFGWVFARFVLNLDLYHLD